ncbi:hypothetical protein [Segnochrobactrum spirostomi]|uniref:hypothetical protein n=1 Tax=Segnochrobactrum spirostomi TaxID=2608987 RepID=UPI001AD84544|nr:hypothetical protein [Segnochrobactrum spirostomi]
MIGSKFKAVSLIAATVALIGTGFAFPVVPRAAAAVYCKTAGVPKGCVARPAPAARAAVHCTRPGYPVGCVAKPAARAAATPGVGAAGPGVSAVNRGGPVNRVGVR